jgi:hypothetical protein
MPFPKKFKHLLELTLKDVEAPDYGWLVYAVCGCDEGACGWGGWMLEAAFRNSTERHRTCTGDRLLSTAPVASCPICGKPLFRTDASIRMVPSTDQTEPLAEHVDTTPMEYE